METDARSKYLGKQYGQVKVPTVVVKEKEIKKSFWDSISKGTGSFNPFKKGSKRKIKLF